METNIPLELSAAVSRLDVRVELTGEQIGFRPVRYFPGGADMWRSGTTDQAVQGQTVEPLGT